MRILFDHGTPAGLRQFLSGHSVVRASWRGWDQLRNGDLLRAAESEGFELIVTTDRNFETQQNLAMFPIAILVLVPGTWRIVRANVDTVVAAVQEMSPREYRELRLYPNDN